jgi:hypothetical protein
MAHHAPWSHGHVEWDDPVPEKHTLAVPWLKLYPGKEYDFRVLSHAAFLPIMHYNGERSLPCTDKTGQTCWFNHVVYTGKLFRKYAWLHVLDRQQKQQVIICVTEGGVQREPRLKEKTIDLRGARLQIKRAGSNYRATMLVKLELAPELCGDYLAAPCDLKELLYIMWAAPLRDVEGETAEVVKQEKRRKAIVPLAPVPGVDVADQAEDKKPMPVPEFTRKLREAKA